MEEKYFNLGVAVELPEEIRATVVTLSSFQNHGLRMKEAKSDIIGWQKTDDCPNDCIRYNPLN